MTLFYLAQEIPYFDKVIIVSISDGNGSIQVDHVVVLKVDPLLAEEQQTQAVDSIYESVTESNCTMEEKFDGILCFNVSKATVNKQDFILSDLCPTVPGFPDDYQKYFYGVETPNKEFLCVTNCSRYNPYFIDCNRGQCLLNSKGPHCFCETSNQFWYTGNRCQVTISKAGVYGGVASGLAVLFIIIFLLIFFLTRRKRDPEEDWLTNSDDIWEYSDPIPAEDDYSPVNFALEISSENDTGAIVLTSDRASPASEESGSSSRGFNPLLDNVNSQKMVTPRPEPTDLSVSY